jgi:hypothetical protein
MVVLSPRNDVSPSPVRRAGVNPVFTSKRKKGELGRKEGGTKEKHFARFSSSTTLSISEKKEATESNV